MALPKIEHPIYEMYVLSLDKKVKFRPFLVKEEKLLLMAKESKESAEISRAIYQIINNCVLDEVDIDRLPLFDIEMIFLNLRARSIGETVKLSFNCQHKLENGEVCNTDTPYALEIDKVTYSMNDSVPNIIKLTDNTGIKLNYPTISSMTIGDGLELFEIVLKLIAENTEYIYDKDSVYKIEDIEVDELLDFLENLTPDQLERINYFFKNTPKVVIKDKIKCRKCDHIHELEVDSVYGFFT